MDISAICEEIRLIWQEVLEIDNIGIEDEFLALGGSSMLALTVLMLINEHFCIELPVESLFEASTIQKLAILVQEEKIAVER